MMTRDKKPLIIVLGGTYGVGKTTLAHQLGIDLQIMNRINIGGIAYSIKTLLPNHPVAKIWKKRNKTETEYLKGIKNQSELVGRVIHSIADSAEPTSENYIIDGVQSLPEFLPMDKVLFFHVFVSDDTKHDTQFNKPNITKLRQNNIPYNLAKKVEKLIREACKGYPIFKIDNIGTPEEASKKVIKMIKDK